MRTILCFLALFTLSAFAAPSKPGVAEILESAKPTDWRSVQQDHLLYMDLPQGRVVIELAPEFSPRSVKNVKALAKEKYWDGLAVVRVQDNYVVQWADPNAEDAKLKRLLKKASAKVSPAELDRSFDANIPFYRLPDPDTYAPEVGFSNGFAVARDPGQGKMWLVHCYGAVGVGRDNAPDSGNGSELYAVIGQAPRHLDRNVTLIGRVIQGMDVLAGLPRGKGKMGFYEKPEQNVIINSIRLGSDLPAAEQAHLEVLRTDTPLFARFFEARRHRSEEWFHVSAGHLDVCNGSIPVREKSKK